MKVRACKLNVGKNSIPGFYSRALQSAAEYKITARFAVVLLITALLSPMFLLGSARPVSAASILPIPQIPAPVSPPSAALAFASSLSSSLPDSIINNVPEPVVALNAYVSNGYSSVSSYFTAPSMPNGFALAQPSSPFASSVSSVISSFGSFLGLTVSSAESANAVAAGSAAIAPSAAMVSQPAGSVWFDFDGDGKADVGRWHPSTKEWKIKQSSNGAYLTQTSGAFSASLIAPGNFDSDNKTDIAIFNAGTWTINKSASGTTQTVTFGQSGDKPVVGDYDGDGISDLAVFRPSSATWLIQNSSNGTTTTTQFGSSGDIPVAGNYDGDYRTDIAVYRPSNGTWYVQGSTAGYSAAQWGNASDTPVPADYDGDGKTDKAVFRSSIGTWYVSQSSNGAVLSPAWGNYADQPVPADYDGDNKADFSVWRPSTGVWHIYKSATGVYQSETLGAPGDTAVPSAYLKQIGSQVYTYDFAKTRLSPKNSMGGTDLYSRNFSWGAGLVNLPGRAGLDAGFGISYNSLIWTKDGSTMVFDADKSNVSPGFRFGFPVIEPNYLDGTTGQYNYLMVTPSGAKVEFKQQLGASNIYETKDSNYTQLVLNKLASPTSPVEFVTITVTTTDGTMMNYAWIGNAYRCTQIKDRNGNYITIENDEYGLLKSITDTLGRVINVAYDADNNPLAITQNWKAANGSGATQLHTYANFYYTNVAMYPQFNSTSVTSVYGPATGDIKALQSIVYPGGSSTHFDYNVYGQVYKVTNRAANNDELNRTRINLHSYDLPAGVQTDCPRFTRTWNFVKDFNGGNEVLLKNEAPVSGTYNLPGNISGSAMMIEVAMQDHPNSLISKTYVGASGWNEGLPLATEDCVTAACAGTDRKRWTWTNWTQDDENQSYILNPRVTDSKVGDATNTKRTTVSYYPVSLGSPVALYGLVSTVRVYDTDQSTVKKKSITDYNLDSAYTSRRIIGLPATSQLYEGENTLVSKVSYAYDGGDFTTDTALNQNLTSVIQHDHGSRGYSSTFIIGRGNLTSTTRHNVTEATSAVTSSIKYNTAGGVVSQTDPLSRTVKISYADVFNDDPTNLLNRNTFAYPTKITDPAGNFSDVKYRFDIGANVWAKSPAPAGNTIGKETTRSFDTVGRLERQTIVNNGAYTRYEYPINSVQSKVFATITAGENEAVSESWTDGAGRVRQSRSELPGSTGGWSGTLTEYDILGRTKRQSVPTETDANWNPAGDDLTRGFLWTSQEYDWKGRVTRKINTDGLDSPTPNNSDMFISYDGCGCAGGQVTTIQSELVPRDDQPTNSARRIQKLYQDILGRTVKTEAMEWDGITPYTTTVDTFNGRDQVTKTRQYAGAEGSQTFQDITIGYDGHGRLETRHYPIEDALTNTTWVYNQDDSIQKIIDPRGAITNYAYNSRGLVEQISYSVPTGSTIPAAPTTTFIYDAAGNRTNMQTNLVGSTSYAYNSLSQLTSETKTFTGLSGNFTIGYSYSLGGGLKSITDPFQSTVNYTNDKTGRLTGVSGTPFGNNTSGNYIDGIQYRAFGAIKQMTYKTDDSALVSMQYDNRLRVSNYQVASATVAGGFVQKSGFEYNADSRPKAVDNVLDAGFDRTFKYDFAGRLTNNQFGTGTRPDGQQFTTYSQTIGYDTFSNMTSRQTNIWSGSESFTAAYTNATGRRQAASGESLVFDALGNIVDITYSTGRVRFERSKFDAAGRMAEFSKRQQYGGGQTTFHDITKITTQSYDGDGERVKEFERTEQTQNPAPPGVAQPVITEEAKYYVRSAVTGKIITELNAAGDKTTTKVYVGSALLAEQRIYPATQQNPASSEVVWQHGDPVTGSVQQTLKTGALAIYSHSRRELEPLGGIVPTHDPYYSEEINTPEYEYGGDIRRPEWGCTMPDTGHPAPCSLVAFAANVGLFEPAYTIEWHDRMALRGQPPPSLDGNYVGADNRRADEYERIPGLRRTQVRQGREGNPVSAWAVDNSVASQTQQQESSNMRDFRAAVQAARIILQGDNPCSKLFGTAGEAALNALENAVNENTFQALESSNTGIRMGVITLLPPLRVPGRIPSLDGSRSEYGFIEPNSITINTRGSFIRRIGLGNDRLPSFGRYRPGTLQSRVTQLLHEIGHLIFSDSVPTGTLIRNPQTKKTDTYKRLALLFPSDGGDNKTDLSEQNTDRVLDACRKQINSL
jgi:YD repeat-containing protein